MCGLCAPFPASSQEDRPVSRVLIHWSTGEIAVRQKPPSPSFNIEPRGIIRLEQVLEAELHLTRNGISRTRDASERRRTEVPVRRLEIWRVRDVEHLQADLDTPGSGLAQRLAEREIHAPL